MTAEELQQMRHVVAEQRKNAILERYTFESSSSLSLLELHEFFFFFRHLLTHIFFFLFGFCSFSHGFIMQ